MAGLPQGCAQRRGSQPWAGGCPAAGRADGCPPDAGLGSGGGVGGGTHVFSAHYSVNCLLRSLSYASTIWATGPRNWVHGCHNAWGRLTVRNNSTMSLQQKLSATCAKLPLG